MSCSRVLTVTIIIYARVLLNGGVGWVSLAGRSHEVDAREGGEKPFEARHHHERRQLGEVRQHVLGHVLGGFLHFVFVLQRSCQPGYDQPKRHLGCIMKTNQTRRCVLYS